MTRLTTILMAAALFVMPPAAWAEDAIPSSSEAKIDALVSDMVDIMTRT